MSFFLIQGLKTHMTPTYAYDVSKAAVHYLTVKLAPELAQQNITVNAIAPGSSSYSHIYDFSMLTT